jgi:hypothetical protein
MDYRFFLTYKGVKTEILEPVKFDGFRPLLKRADYHGVDLDLSIDEIIFDKKAGFRILKDAYEAEGVDAEIEFLAEYTCNGRDWMELYRGTIDFGTGYEERYGKWCGIATSITTSDVRLQFLNRRESEVALDLRASMNDAPLPEYRNLNREIVLPSKTIRMTSEARQEYGEGNEPLSQEITFWRNNDEQDWGTMTCGGDLRSCKRFYSTLHLVLNEATYAENAEVHNGISVSLGIDDPMPNPIMTIKNGVDLSASILDIDISGNISYDFSGGNRQLFQIGSKSIGNYNHTIIINVGENEYLIENVNFDGRCGDAMEFSIKTTLNLQNPTGIIDIIMPLSGLVNIATGDTGFTSIGANLTINENSHVRLTANSQYEATAARTCLVHETLSRLAEIYTDGKITVKSDYFGRTDSEIHPVAADGCGSLRAIANGYKIRNAALTKEGETPKVFASWKKVFNSFMAIDNAGYCFEGNTVRVEKADYFYRNDTVLVLSDIDALTKEFDAPSNFTKLKIGYKKWLSGEYNSIDGFHGTREYYVRTKKGSQTKEYSSDLIADGYAIEATRRRQIEDASKDWQYDNDLFIIDLKRDGSALAVNTGVTDTDGSLIDPATIYNARLSPARMAMNHLGEVTRAVPPVYPKDLRFSAAEGYSAARMKSEGNCVAEKHAISENQDIASADFVNPDQIQSHHAIEILKFKYPLRPSEFARLRANPYGLINADGIEGWLKECEWDTAGGIASFELIIKK